MDRSFKSDYEVLESLRLRTGMYTGEQSLSSIVSYLHGYQAARLDCQFAKYDGLDYFKFSEYVAKKLEFSEPNTAGWANMILARIVYPDASRVSFEKAKELASQENHSKSIKKFYELLDAFREQE